MQFKYQTISSNLLRGLSQRTNEVLVRRFGLKSGERETLEAIGGSFGITRERVRQIEREGIFRVRAKVKDYPDVFKHLNDIVKSFGGLKKEDMLLQFLGENKAQNGVFFLLNLSDEFKRIPEDQNFHTFWTNRTDASETAKKVVGATLKKFEEVKTPLFLDNIFANLKSVFSGLFAKPQQLNKNVLGSYLEISKKIQKNPEGQLGMRSWIEINPRGIKDKAYLVFKKESKPLHFTDVAKLIEQLPFEAKRKTQVAAVHNELIRDPRFVLVGRGLYALKEWGFEPGVVKDVIFTILRGANKPLSKSEIIKEVAKKRFVRENTIFLNLQDKNYFLRDNSGNYIINPVREA